jgi:hypothetical protein
MSLCELNLSLLARRFAHLITLSADANITKPIIMPTYRKNCFLQPCSTQMPTVLPPLPQPLIYIYSKLVHVELLCAIKSSFILKI